MQYVGKAKASMRQISTDNLFFQVLLSLKRLRIRSAEPMRIDFCGLNFDWFSISPEPPSLSLKVLDHLPGEFDRRI
jgi:hypothetical protein